MKCPTCNEHFQFKSTDKDNGFIGKWYCGCSIADDLGWEERYKRFMKEYEELTKKYQMGFVIADKWETGFETLEVFDEKEKCYVYDDGELLKDTDYEVKIKPKFKFK